MTAKPLLYNSRHRQFREDILAMKVDDVMKVEDSTGEIIRSQISNWGLTKQFFVTKSRHGRVFIIRTDD